MTASALVYSLGHDILELKNDYHHLKHLKAKIHGLKIDGKFKQWRRLHDNNTKIFMIIPYEVVMQFHPSPAQPG